ncbi:PREDICTED: uncharacterized protein LOC104597350 [Nelumbo nucifera]|uniref:Uncharacterized protein LOC104597350 n=1 Tax=Nelumbo nucifera TaxID=4432 RepID=A0A1U7ZU64_NELNU|nr:PREDICTED: uncharacterized protein LOC104597350 [Nelumbo nucifera]
MLSSLSLLSQLLYKVSEALQHIPYTLHFRFSRSRPETLSLPTFPSPIPTFLSPLLSSLSLSPQSIFFLICLLACVFSSLFLPELATSQASLEEESSIRVVRALYDALGVRDVETIQRLLAPDIEWWFHGPPSHQYMMRLLTGVSSDESFVFVPLSFAAFGSTVLVEGCDQNRSVSWVHAWTVADGIITQVREYFDTSLTVSRFGKSGPSPSSSSSIRCPHLWQSQFTKATGKSVPGLVLAI